MKHRGVGEVINFDIPVYRYSIQNIHFRFYVLKRPPLPKRYSHNNGNRLKNWPLTEGCPQRHHLKVVIFSGTTRWNKYHSPIWDPGGPRMIQPSQPRYKQPIPQNRISNLDMAANSFYSASTNFLIAYHLLTKHPGVILNAALHNDAEPMLEPVSKSSRACSHISYQIKY